MPPTIRVLVLNDELVTSSNLRLLLSATRDLHLVGEITDIQRLPEICSELQPHIVLINGGGDPFVFDAPALIHQLCSQAKIIAILDQNKPIRTNAILSTNLAGYLFKQEINESIVDLIRAVTHGATWFSRPLAEHLLVNKASQSSEILSNREHEVLKLLAQGERNRKIARTLCISENTLEHHIGHIYQKLGVKGRAEASKWYWNFYHEK